MDRAQHNESNLISFERVLINAFSKLPRLEDCFTANLDSSDSQPFSRRLFSPCYGESRMECQFTSNQ
jgi:hypothetical protein